MGAFGPLFFFMTRKKSCYLCGMYLTENLQYLADTFTEVDWVSEIHGWNQLMEAHTELSAATLHTISTLVPFSMERLLSENLRQTEEAKKAKKPGLILLDADGTLTDGGMYYTENGDQIKRFNVKDGMIIHRLSRRQGVKFGLISSGFAGNILRQRAETIGIQKLYFGTRRKVEVIEEWLAELELSWEDVAYAGDDLNDLEVIKRAGFTACPRDAVRRIREASQTVLTKEGGQGCIREFLENVLGYEI